MSGHGEGRKVQGGRPEEESVQQELQDADRQEDCQANEGEEQEECEEWDEEVDEVSAEGPAPERSQERCTWTWQTLEVTEYQTLKLGPFEAGVTCEILHAWYGIPGEESKQVDTTLYLRNAFSPSKGLTLSGYNRLFGDPAPLRMKRICVKYRLGNVRTWDVSEGRYAEGGSKLGLLPIIAAKAVTNMLGVTVAASGYAVCKALTAVQNTIGFEEAEEDESKSVADSSVFQAAFGTWLRCNGIVPSVSYEPLPGSPDFVPEDMKQTPIIVCNHVCYMDGMVLASVFSGPKIIAMKGTLNVPVLGLFAADIGVIEVDRSDPSSRSATLQAIEDHAESWRPGRRPLLLFPEGTTSNGEGLLEFKKGAFIPGLPVRPVVLCYTGSWNPANTNYRMTAHGDLQATGDAEWVEQFLGHVMHSLQIRVLPPYEPSEAEQADPLLYAANVHEVMVRAHEQLRDEVAARRTEAEQRSFQGMARRSVDMVEDVTSRFMQGARDAASALLPPALSQQPAASSRAPRARQSTGDREGLDEAAWRMSRGSGSSGSGSRAASGAYASRASNVRASRREPTAAAAWVL